LGDFAKTLEAAARAIFACGIALLVHVAEDRESPIARRQHPNLCMVLICPEVPFSQYIPLRAV
jgi:hypothetical protein